MFAIGKVLQKNVMNVQPRTFTSVSIYDIQEYTMQEATNNKEKTTNIFSLLSFDDKETDSMNEKSLDDLKQEECMYYNAKP